MPASDSFMISATDVESAAARIQPFARRTPIMSSTTFDERVGGEILFKCENFQTVGAFKFRGALNALLLMNENERAKGVVTHSSGNHAQALAKAARILGAPATIVMPTTAPKVKRDAVEGYGATVVTCAPTLQARESTVAELIERHGYALVHPYDDWNVIAGQGTAALELLEDGGPFDAIVVPCGGGGLLSGTAIIVKARSPRTLVIGVEPENADDARRSLLEGKIVPSGDPKTIADGLRTSLGGRDFRAIQKYVDSIVSASELEIVEATRFVWERLKIVIEPSSAVPVAAILNGRIDVKGKRIGVILSGGNVDASAFFEALTAKIG